LKRQIFATTKQGLGLEPAQCFVLLLLGWTGLGSKTLFPDVIVLNVLAMHKCWSMPIRLRLEVVIEARNWEMEFVTPTELEKETDANTVGHSFHSRTPSPNSEPDPYVLRCIGLAHLV
jgi:hypothetical protein